MSKDVWFPIGYTLTKGVKIKRLLDTGKNWQIFDTDGSKKILCVETELADRWVKHALINELQLVSVFFGQKYYKALFVEKGYKLMPVNSKLFPLNKNEALNFAASLCASRQATTEASFHDAIYVEQFLRLLPLWTDKKFVDDKTVLGTYLSSGVILSTDLESRLLCLSSWLTADDLKDIVKRAGIDISDKIVTLNSRELYSKKQIKQEGSKQEIFQLNEKVFHLPGRQHLENFFNEHIIEIIRHQERYATFGIEFPSAIVLYGPSGSGKTYAVEQLADFLGWPCWSINSGSVSSPYIHDTSKKISELFDKAIESAPSILIIDEMEAFLSNRQSDQSNGQHHMEEVAEFLRRIPEASKKQVLIIAMTNLIDSIDPAILRRGRFDHIIEVSMPSREEVRSLVDSLLNDLPKSLNLNLDKLIDFCTDKPLSDLAFLIREAARLTVKHGKIKIDQESIDTALETLSNDIHQSTNKIGFF